MTRFLPLLLFFALAMLLAFALLQKPQHDIMKLEGSMMREKLPTLTLHARDGTSQKLALNGRVTVINFFASWCTACVGDHAELLKLSRAYPQLVLEGIAWNDTTSRTDEWLAQHRNPYTHVWFDTKGKAAVALGLRGLPESYVVDKHGVIRYHLPGPMTPQLRNDIMEPLIGALMEEP